MKLLVVDDEEITRTGVVSSVNWKSIGIDEVFQADDGVHGLEIAREYCPEIILCDVRMPRMNGIDMLKQVEQFLPDTVPIFISGYSDKEYLKAAIKLKSVNYIEKPLDPDEIREAVLEAKNLYNQKQRSHQGETLHSIETGSELALHFTVPYQKNDSAILSLSSELGLTPYNYNSFISVIVRLRNSPENALLAYGGIYTRLKDYLKQFKLDCVYVEKKPGNIVYFIFGEHVPEHSVLNGIFSLIAKEYTAFEKYYIAAGGICSNVSDVYQSYSDAVILLQSSFFFPCGTVLSFDDIQRQNNTDTSVSKDITASSEVTFSKLLSSLDEKGCMTFLDELFLSCQMSLSLLPNQIRDLYYKLFLALEEARRQQHIQVTSNTDNIMDALENSFNYEELHQSLVVKTGQFFSDVQQAASENATITMIKDYIGKNYMNDLLSVKDISSYVFLSVSYVCTFFKNETGMTLNQYLTEYRMERAKELLEDPKYKITDISAKVGYSDGNYFGKTFKKYTGFSPSEYREKMKR